MRASLLGFLLTLSILTAVSCAGIPEASAKPAASPAAATAPAVPKASERLVSSLPPAAQAFLPELRDHVRRGDWSWAADHADSSFLRAMEGRDRDPHFYTYLFSAGVLSEEISDDYRRFEAIPLAKVRDMVWDDARIEGPVAIVKGRFLLTKGEAFPFTLRLLWRLEPPRILGVQP